jgi:hypothetical protein
MGRPYGDDLGRRFLFAYDKGESSLEHFASRFFVSGLAKKISAQRNRGFYGTPPLQVEHILKSPHTLMTILFTGPSFDPIGGGAGDGAYPQALGNRNIQLTTKISSERFNPE